MRFFLFLLCIPLVAHSQTAEPQVRVRELKEYLSKEKTGFSERETARKNTLDELDRLSSEVNRAHQRIEALTQHQQEIAMSLENLEIEVEKQREQEMLQRKRIALLLKVAYRIRRDGVLRFVVNGKDLSMLAGRVRILYRTLRSHSTVSREMAERSKRLREGEGRLAVAKAQLEQILAETRDQQSLLGDLRAQKKQTLAGILKKQSSYQAALKEYKRVSARLKNLFQGFENQRDTPLAELAGRPRRASLPLPVENGTVVHGFGKSVHEKFHTVTYYKGVEIEAPLDAPVLAVLPGTVEFDGWLKGLGNVVILHHGEGFYSLSAHLNKAVARRGMRVSQGDTVGLVGDTGSNETPSLYFELRENGRAIDPLVYFAPKALTHLN